MCMCTLKQIISNVWTSPLLGPVNAPTWYKPLTQQSITLLVHQAHAPNSPFQSCVIVGIHCVSVWEKKPECLRRLRLIPLYITGQAHVRFDHKSVLFFTLPFFILCGHSSNSLNHSTFHHVETEDRAMAKAQYSCAAICVCYGMERNYCPCWPLRFSTYESMAVWALGWPHWGTTTWVKAHPNYTGKTMWGICLQSHISTLMPSNKYPSHITKSAITALILPCTR